LQHINIINTAGKADKINLRVLIIAATRREFMITFTGKGAFGGYAMGQILFYSHPQTGIKAHTVENPSAELNRFFTAQKTAIEQLGKLYEKALSEVGRSSAMIFQIHQMMLEDLNYVDSIINVIQNQGQNAEYAISVTSAKFANMFAAMEDPYMRERAADVKDISQRLINVLTHNHDETISFEKPVIIAADDLVPSEIMQLDKDKVLAFVTCHGSTNSHTAILARIMNIPAVVNLGTDFTKEYNGRQAIVDGYNGKLIISPNQETSTYYTKIQMQEKANRALLREQLGKDNVTQDGQKIHIVANIGSTADIPDALENDAGGIGLFRSEFLYLENTFFPSEQEQFEAYKTVAQSMENKKVVIRTMDIGADKQADYFKLPKEENPAMGYRAIRICLTQLDIFYTQLRALYRASAFGNIAIMFPMITSVEEVQQIKKIAAQVRRELDREGLPYVPNTKLGIMIETPAAAMISDLLAKEVDFFSIGTNDLTQYTLAIDRQNTMLDQFFQPHHKSVLRLIKMVADNAHRNHIWCSICGDMGSDLHMTPLFLAMGIDEISVPPSSILAVRKKVRETNVSMIQNHLFEKWL